MDWIELIDRCSKFNWLGFMVDIEKFNIYCSEKKSKNLGVYLSMFLDNYTCIVFVNNLMVYELRRWNHLSWGKEITLNFYIRNINYYITKNFQFKQLITMNHRYSGNFGRAVYAILSLVIFAKIIFDLLIINFGLSLSFKMTVII